MGTDGDGQGSPLADVFEYAVRGTHRSLVRSLSPPVRPLPRGPARDKGLVVMPVARPEPLLGTAAALAGDLGWPLLLLCSRDNNARRVYLRVRRDWPELEVTVADLLHRDLLRARREWRTAGHWAALQRMDVDTNRKRNLGLAAARMTGHAWVLFVDDDVLRFPPVYVAAALESLESAGGLHVAGWALDHFPDNSVVHHARRDFLRLHQDVFIGGGALLVRVKGWDPPGFPPVYNEDWLFLYDALAQKAVAAGPDVGQQSFDPYASPRRARSEEFGDVLGEGLYHLLHVGAAVDVATDAGYWRSVHAKRTRLIARILGELRRRYDDARAEVQRDRLHRALAAIDESCKQLTRATPQSLAEFVRAWRADEETWREFLARLPERGTVKESLVYLGLHDAWIVTSGPASQVGRAEHVS
jgi:glycosyltransferase involved in cell wall biosynthesis